jgi:hypothetical protein
MSISTGVVAMFIGASGLVVAACATGGNPNSEGKVDALVDNRDAPGGPVDASTPDAAGSLPDAFVSPDAFVPPIDGFVPPPDSPMSSLFCTANNQCTNDGECCFTIEGQGLCVPGTVLFGTCVPIP